MQKNISKCRSDISGSFRRTPWHCAKWLRNSLGKRYQRIRIRLTGEVETPSFLIRRQASDAKYPDGMSAEKNSGCETSGWNVDGATPSGFSKRICGALPYPTSLKEKHTSLAIIIPRTITYPIQICCPDHWLKCTSLATSFRQPATAHVPPSSDSVSGRPVRTSFAMDSKELSSISDCFGDKKAIKTPKLNTI